MCGSFRVASSSVFVSVRRACCPTLDFPGHLILCLAVSTVNGVATVSSRCKVVLSSEIGCLPKTRCLYLNVPAGPIRIGRILSLYPQVPSPRQQLIRMSMWTDSRHHTLIMRLEIPSLENTRNILDPVLVIFPVTRAN